MNKKMIAGLMACAVLAGAAVGGTIAWLTDKTEKVENTFTVGNVSIELWENDYITEKDNPTDKTTIGELDTTKKVSSNTDYHFVPGDTLPKNPWVTVKANSEKCYLFVKITEAHNECTLSKTSGDSEDRTVDPLIIWEVCDQGESENTDPQKGWVKHQVSGTPKGTTYYYRIVEKASTDQEFKILKDDQVKIDLTITKEMVSKINGEADKLDDNPTLTFEAAAVQFDNITDMEAAFKETGWETSGN